MTIYDINDIISLTLREYQVSNGEITPDTMVSITVETAIAIRDLLEKEIDIRRRRARAGGKGRMTPARTAALAKAQKLGVEARLAKKAASA